MGAKPMRRADLIDELILLRRQVAELRAELARVELLRRQLEIDAEQACILLHALVSTQPTQAEPRFS